jgi:hypothetical protein
MSSNKEQIHRTPSSHAGTVHFLGIPRANESHGLIGPSRTHAVVPQPDADAGGTDDVAEELLSDVGRVEEELDRTGLDIRLPGEDRAPLEADQEQREPPETWGRL